MKEILTALRSAVTHNVVYKLIALGFAVIVWVGVQSEQRVEDRARVTVHWVVPDGMALVEPPIESAQITVEGVQAFVRSLRQKELSMEVDLSKATEGDVAVDLSQRRVAGLPAQLRVKSFSPSQLRVTLDRIMKRKVPVTVTSVGSIPEGYRLASLKVSPDRAELEGPAVLVRAIDNALTEEVDLGGLKEDIDVDVGLALRKGVAPSERTGNRFTVHVDVEPITQRRSFAEVPVLVRDPAFAPANPHATVVLEGPEETLAGLADDDVSIVVYVPPSFTAAHGQARQGKVDGPRYEVVHEGGELVHVLSVSPERIDIERRP